MRKYLSAILAFSLLLGSCRYPSSNAGSQEPTPYQQRLLDEGWEYSKMEGCELTDGYGYEPQYGFQDNYFDVVLGDGTDCLVKIMDAKTDKCIRMAYVQGGSSTVISQIPQKRVYLKIAYGKGLMEIKTELMLMCKFTTDTFFERSATVFDFGKKNSQSVINYTLEIRVAENAGKNNFETRPINEEEFLK